MPNKKNQRTDVVIIGASAAGLMCAIEAGKRGRKVTVLDHANKAGKKILMSGGGRCNFTNNDIDASNFISHNPHFCKSALSRYTQWDFIALINDYHIPYQERDLGKLFCEDSAKDIVDMLLAECKKVKVKIILNCNIQQLEKKQNKVFTVLTSNAEFTTKSLVIASGGLSIPKMCASPFGYKIAQQFSIKLWPTFAGLVPFTMQLDEKQKYSVLAGIAVECLVSNERIQFKENILFTHRGLSGPAILQISSYWQPGEKITINLLPDLDVYDLLSARRAKQPQVKLKTVLNEVLPKRVVSVVLGHDEVEQALQYLSKEKCRKIADKIQNWQFKPNATEGYRTAEVTLGGVDCNALSSRTMEANDVKGLYFIGEIMDVTGWLGGYNFQWAWSSGWCAGQVV